MFDPLDIDALHATWEAAQKGTPHFLPWATAITDAWPAIYERLRELEAERDDDELLTRVDNWLAAAQESDDDETEDLMRDLRDAIVDHGLRELTEGGQ